MYNGFEYRKRLFLSLCDKVGAPRPITIRPSLPEDLCDTTDINMMEVRLNISAAICDPEQHVAHVFGHWLADLHTDDVRSDEVADIIGNMVLTTCKHKVSFFESLRQLATTWFE